MKKKENQKGLTSFPLRPHKTNKQTNKQTNKNWSNNMEKAQEKQGFYCFI